MKELGYLPDLTLCSGARRTRETAQIVREFLPRHGVSYSDSLYNAPSDSLFDTVRAGDDRHGSVVIPSFSEYLSGKMLNQRNCL